MPDLQRIATNGIHLNVALDGPEDGPLVLLVHGFPESWYSWRHQLPVLASAGYRVAAPDVRGYGDSDAPHDVSAYAMAEMTADFAGLAEALSGEPAVIIGHDWGAPMAWASALFHPERFRAVAGLSVPYTAPSKVPPMALYKKMFTDRGRFFYINYFQEEGVAEAELDADPATVIRKFYGAISGGQGRTDWPTDKPVDAKFLDGVPEPEMPMPWLTHEDVAIYEAQFKTSGFRGPLNRYRHFDSDYEILLARGDYTIHQPALFIAGDEDPVVSMVPGDPEPRMRDVLPDLRGIHILPGIGHWTQQEAPDQVNALLLDWLKEL
ncbi:MAG: alpha/beta hydrolase [Pseudomonadota bacterium]